MPHLTLDWQPWIGPTHHRFVRQGLLGEAVRMTLSVEPRGSGYWWQLHDAVNGILEEGAASGALMAKHLADSAAMLYANKPPDMRFGGAFEEPLTPERLRKILEP